MFSRTKSLILYWRKTTSCSNKY